MKHTKFLCIACAFLISGCATPAVTLKSETTGQIVRCGGDSSGSMAGGMIGYNIQKTNDEACVSDYESKGFKQIQNSTVGNISKESNSNTNSQTKNSTDVYSELSKLDELKKKGIITDAEFDAQKKKILSGN